MASIKRVNSKDFLICFMCKGLFTDPVSIPCGHNFCRTCITQHWDTNAPYRCPKCQKAFSSKPDLRANPSLSDQISEMKLCKEHNRPLEMFCRDDQTLLCQKCVPHHKDHNCVSLKEEFTKVKSSLQQVQAETQQMVEQRHDKKQEFRKDLERSLEDAEKEKTTGLQGFTALIESVLRRKQQFIEGLQEQQRLTQKQANDLIEELEQEIIVLKKRSTELEQLSHAEDQDHLLFIQRYNSLRPAAALKDWSMVSFKPPKFDGFAARSIDELKEKLNEESQKLMELKELQQFAVDLTLDPDTAHPNLVLSEDLKQVHHSDVRKKLPENPNRFLECPNLLGKQGFSSGKIYFEVEVKGKTEWDLGVALESIDRKGNIKPRPQFGYWSIWLRKEHEYKALAGPSVLLKLRCAPQKVGVFVDYEGGVVSFYDANTADLIYSFTGCCFNDKLFPYISPCTNNEGTNSAPLIITEVSKKKKLLIINQQTWVNRQGIRS